MQELNLSQLESTRSQVLISLGTSDKTASQRISSCRYHARCLSIYCPRCLQSAGYARKDKLLAAVSRESGRKWKLITLTAANIWPEAVREAAQAVTRASRATLKRLKIADYSQTFETSYTDWTEDAHPHVHLVAELPRGGRRHVSPADLEESYLDALPGWLHPASSPVTIDTTRSTEAVTYYVNKSPFHQSPGTRPHAQRLTDQIVNGVRSTQGLQKFNLRGSLAA